MALHGETTPFTTAIADANRWLDQIAAELDVDRREALHVLRAAYHALRDRLSAEQNAHLSAQMPTLVRGLYYEGWRPGHAETAQRGIGRFLDEVLARLERGASELDAYEAARAAYAVLGMHVSSGEVRKIVETLPHELRVLWEAP